MDGFEFPVWRTPPEAPEFWRLDTWYKGDHCHYYPRNRRKTLEDVLYGWEPPVRLITADTRVLAFGSCFAQYFVQYLSRCGYNRWHTPVEQHSQSEENLLVVVPSGFDNIFVVNQQFRWAFREFIPGANLWFSKDKRMFEATEERREKVRTGLIEADLFIITLGLSEIWFDEVEGEPMWRTIPTRFYEPGRHVCRKATAAETLASFHALDALVDRYLPGKRFIFTLSPIPLNATFRDQSPITANQASKAVLRAALDDFLADPSIARKARYHYFPAYEIVLNLCDQPFLPDNMHVRPEVAATVVNIFSNLYTDVPVGDISLPDEDSQVRSLEEQIRVLQADLQAKEQVIRELDRAARERLNLIQRLTNR